MNILNILIVDDDTGLLEQLKTTLKRKHYGVDIAENSEQALDKVFESPLSISLIMPSGTTGLKRVL